MKEISLQSVIAELLPDIRKRIYALKKLQLETIKIEAEFHSSVYNLEQKLQGKHDEIFKKRADIVNGGYEPTDDECLMPDEDVKLDLPAEGQEKTLGVPNFWLTVFKNVNEIHGMIQESDEEVLKHLVDVRAFSKPGPDLSFQLEFHFSPNEYFQNSVLTKTYLMKCSPDEDDPFAFEGPEIYKSIGCEIMWDAGKSPQKTSELSFYKTNSFFNFFNPPELKASECEENDKIEVRGIDLPLYDASKLTFSFFAGLLRKRF